jgi:hypothetical protein
VLVYNEGVNAHREEVKAFAISQLMAGQPYRSVQSAIQEKFGESVSLGVLNLWSHQDPETAQNVSQAHLAQVGHGRIRVARKALDLLEEAIDSGAIPTSQIPTTYGIVMDKMDNLLKLVEDKRNADNERIMQIRMELRKKDPHALREALLLTENPTVLPAEASPPATFNHHRDGRPHLD